MTAGNLRDQLYADQAPLEELRIILISHFDQAQENGDSILYEKESKPALSVAYTKKGGISSIESRPALSSVDVDEIRQKIERGIIQRGDTKIRRDFCFSAVPVTGAWRYRDRFQILPAPENAPRPPAQVGEHPFVLEVPFEDSADRIISGERASRRMGEANLILSGLVPSIFAKRRMSGEQRWALVLEADQDPEGPVWTQASYFCKGFQHLADDFSNSTTMLESVPDSDFYLPWHGIPGSERLDLPASIETMLDRIESLDPARRERFTRWCFWLNFSRLSWSLSTSAGYMGLIQAIEALRPEMSRPHCDSCQQALPPGPTQQFSEFLDRFVPRQNGETEKERKKLYGLRSGLTHGGTLLESDLGFGFGSFHPGFVRESNATRLASQLARLAGINWLLQGGE